MWTCNSILCWAWACMWRWCQHHSLKGFIFPPLPSVSLWEWDPLHKCARLPPLHSATYTYSFFQTTFSDFIFSLNSVATAFSMGLLSPLTSCLQKHGPVEQMVFYFQHIKFVWRIIKLHIILGCKPPGLGWFLRTLVWSVACPPKCSFLFVFCFNLKGQSFPKNRRLLKYGWSCSGGILYT